MSVHNIENANFSYMETICPGRGGSASSQVNLVLHRCLNDLSNMQIFLVYELAAVSVHAQPRKGYEYIFIRESFQKYLK